MNHQISKGASKGKEKDRGRRPLPGRSDRFRENRGPRFLNYTPLTVPRGRILDESLQAELISTLKQSQTPKNADTLMVPTILNRFIEIVYT